jgi:hypothetical protein
MKYFIASTIFLFCLIAKPAISQNNTNLISPNLKFNIYIDAYYLQTFNKIDDSLNIAAFAGNSKFTDEFRLNVASLILNYNLEDVRASLEIQYGDNPHLMAHPDNEFIKYIANAKVGYHVIKDLWVDFGYIPDPVGCESGKPMYNIVPSVTVGGYFQPDNFLGLIMSYKISDLMDAKFYLGNPYTLKFGKNENTNVGVQLNVKPIENLTVSYSNLYGDNTDLYEVNKEWLLYNNFVMQYQLTDDIYILGQYDLAHQTGVLGDNDRSEIMTSGFIGAKYKIIDKFSISGRYEFFKDDSGMRTGNLITDRFWLPQGNEWNGYGMDLIGASVSLEFNPTEMSYFKCEYKYNEAAQGQLVFNRNTQNNRQYLLFTTGIRF